jgi:hypothetical protein
VEDTASITLLGIGAVKIVLKRFSLYLDAFNTYIKPPVLERGDLVLFTHDDPDHFDVESLLESLLPDTVIIGPPSIAKPLWETGRVSPGQVRIVYPKEYDKPDILDLGDVTIRVFNTDHFLGWHNVHVSFLLESGGKRIYVTGDSAVRAENNDELARLDCLVASLLNEDTVKGRIDRKWAASFNLCEIISLQNRLNPRLLVVNHLIGCEWAADPGELGSLLVDKGLVNVIVPVHCETPYKLF